MIHSLAASPTGNAGGTEPSRRSVAAALSWVVHRIRQIAFAIFNYLASFFQKKPNTPPSTTVTALNNTGNHQTQQQPPPTHLHRHHTLRSLPPSQVQPINPISSPHSTPLHFNMTELPFEGEENLSTELKDFRRCLQRLTLEAANLLIPKYLTPYLTQLAAYKNQVSNLITTVQTACNNHLPTIAKLEMPASHMSFEDKVKKSSLLLLQAKETLLARQPDPLLAAQSNSLKDSILSSSSSSSSMVMVASTRSLGSDDDDDEEEYQTARQGKSRHTKSRAGEDGTDDLKEFEKAESEIFKLSIWLTQEVETSLERYHCANSAELDVLQNRYIKHVITWLITEEDTELANYLQSTWPTYQPHLMQDIIDVCFNALLKEQKSASVVAKQERLTSQIILLEKQLRGFIDLSTQLESFIPQLIANRAAHLVDYFTNRLAQKLATAPWQVKFNAIFAQGVIATVKAHAHALKSDTGTDAEYVYLNAMATSSISTRFLGKLYGHQFSDDGPIAQKEGEHVLYNEMAEQLLKLLLPENKTVRVEEEEITLDAYDQLYDILKLEEILKPAVDEAFKLYRETKQNLNGILQNLGSDFPAFQPLYELAHTTLTQPVLIKQFWAIYDKDLKTPLKRELKQQIDEIVKKQLVDGIRKALTQLTEPKQLDKLFGEVILPSVNESLLGTLIGHVLSRHMGELALGFVGIKFPTSEVSATMARNNLIISLHALLLRDCKNEVEATGFDSTKLQAIIGGVIDSYVVKIPNANGKQPSYQEILQALNASPSVVRDHETFFDDLVPALIHGIGGWKFTIDKALGILDSVHPGWTTEKIIGDLSGKVLTEATKALRKDHAYLIKEITKALNRIYPDQNALKPLLADAAESSASANDRNFTQIRQAQLAVTAQLLHQMILYPFSQKHSVVSPWYYTNAAMGTAVQQLVTKNSSAIDALISRIYTTLFERKVLNINLVAKLWELTFS